MSLPEGGTPENIEGAITNALYELGYDAEPDDLENIKKHLRDFIANMFQAGYLRAESTEEEERLDLLFKKLMGE